jgi:hypothetical protein
MVRVAVVLNCPLTTGMILESPFTVRVASVINGSLTVPDTVIIRVISIRSLSLGCVILTVNGGLVVVDVEVVAVDAVVVGLDVDVTVVEAVVLDGVEGVVTEVVVEVEDVVVTTLSLWLEASLPARGTPAARRAGRLSACLPGDRPRFPARRRIHAPRCCLQKLGRTVSLRRT